MYVTQLVWPFTAERDADDDDGDADNDEWK